MLTFRPSRPLGTLLLASVLGLGCSALINPDETLLGDPPADGGVMDGAPGDGGGGDADLPDGGPRDGGPIDSGPEDAGPGCALGCDDMIACTEDRCIGDTCAHTPDDSACDDGERCSASMGCVPEGCTLNSECDDGVACTNDRCVGGSCRYTPVTARCDDLIDCTVDRCTPGPTADARGCVFTPNDTMCASGCVVGATCTPGVGCSGGTTRDCGDDDVCTMDFCDPDSGACVNDPRDFDEDGAPAQFVGGVMCVGGTDCDDGNAMIAPGVDELCDGFDNNCNGMTDEGCGTLPDTCATAEPIVLASGRGSVAGTFAALGNEYVTSPLCGASTSGGRDAVYYIDLPSGSWDVTIDTIGSVADTVLGLGSECSIDGLGLVCNNDMDPGRTDASRIFSHRVQAGGGGLRLFVLVEGDGSGELGDYIVNVFLEPAHPDDCNSASGRPLDITGGGTVLGSQPGFAGTSRGSCMPLSDFDEESILTFEATSTTPVLDVYSTDFVPDLFVRAGCAPDSEVACDVGSSIGGGLNIASVSPTVTLSERHFAYIDGRGSYLLVYQP